MEAIGFDLGETLIAYKNIPLSWECHYRKALIVIADQLRVASHKENLDVAEQILMRYNTRVHPREHEVTDVEIFEELVQRWGLSEDHASRALELFFSSFQQTCEVYADAFRVLKALRSKGIRVGILTDVPYGMNKLFVMRDIEPFRSFVDVIVTSVDAGFRKPRTEGFYQLANGLGTEPSRMMYVGNERKDVEGANRAGMKSVCIDRNGGKPGWGQALTVSNLDEILDYL
ncbi:HAD family hydrolase [Paenibacillus ginsengarvi]|nr:HAD family hydrolase [Paenibacillus ginsengarvi]